MPCGLGPVLADVAWQLRPWGSLIELTEAEQETGDLLSLVLSSDSDIITSVLGTHSMISSESDEDLMLSTSGSKEIDMGDEQTVLKLSP